MTRRNFAHRVLSPGYTQSGIAHLDAPSLSCIRCRCNTDAQIPTCIECTMQLDAAEPWLHLDARCRRCQVPLHLDAASSFASGRIQRKRYKILKLRYKTHNCAQNTSKHTKTNMPYLEAKITQSLKKNVRILKQKPSKPKLMNIYIYSFGYI